MSSYIYGRISRARLASGADSELVLAARSPSQAGQTTVPEGKDPVAQWQDVLAALVPAEVLAIHALAMTLGTTTQGSGEDATTVITSATEMTWVFWGMVIAAFGLYLVGSKSFKFQDFVRGAVASLAFILWTMIQPSTAFDALGWDVSSFLRVMIAVGGALVLGLLAGLLARTAQRT